MTKVRTSCCLRRVINYTPAKPMAAVFPGAVKTFSAVVDGTTKDEATLYNTVYDEVTAIQTYHQLLQIVNTQTGAMATGDTQLPWDDSIPQITEGTEFMTLAITPLATTNKLKIEVAILLSASVTDRVTVALFQGATAKALAAVAVDCTAAAQILVTFTHYMDAGTTSSTTFRVRAGMDGVGTLTFNGVGGARKLGGIAASSITISEKRV